MGNPADITAVKLENKKVYLQEGLNETWAIAQAFPLEKVAMFITSLNGKIADIVGSMDPKKSEGTRTTEISSEDYKLISESETVVSLHEGSFGKLIRVKNENILRGPSRNDVFEEEGFETERTDDEEEFLTVLRGRCPSMGKSTLQRKKDVSGTSSSNPDALCEEATKKSKLRMCTDKKASETVGMDQGEDTSDRHFDMHIHKSFFFNRKRRTAINWKLERAVKFAETGITGPCIRNVRVRKTLLYAEKRIVHIAEVTKSPDVVQENGSALHSEKPAPTVQNALMEGNVQERAFSSENAERGDNDMVMEDMESQSTVRNQAHSRSKLQRKHKLTIMHEKSSCRAESADSDTDGDIDSFDAVTISVPRLFTVFDVLFDNDSLSNELDE